MMRNMTTILGRMLMNSITTRSERNRQRTTTDGPVDVPGGVNAGDVAERHDVGAPDRGEAGST
jgi:hypothetical protein